jgi:hypothetical protein
MPRWIGVKHRKKSNQSRSGGKSRRAKYCNTSGKPNKHTPGWVLDKHGKLIHVGVDEEGNDNPLPEN